MVAPLDKWCGKVAVITGASQGIGLAIAKRLAEAGLKVVGLARHTETIEELSKTLNKKNGKLYAVTADVTKEEDILKAFQWVKDNVGPVHILVNNAGIARVADSLREGSTKLWKEVLDTNVLGLCIATREAVKSMKANNIDGHIIHMNSIGGHVVFSASMYCPSKFAVTALTETLRQELNAIQSKIKITSLSPGYVKTNIITNSVKACGLSEIPKAIEDKLKGKPALTVEDIADAVEYILGTPPHVQIHELILRPVGEN